jgi:hypothetical protein
MQVSQAVAIFSGRRIFPCMATRYILIGTSVVLLMALPYGAQRWLQKAKELSAPRINCAGNLKQIGLACAEYRQRHGVAHDSLASLNAGQPLPKQFYCPLRLRDTPWEEWDAVVPYARVFKAEATPARV